MENKPTINPLEILNKQLTLQNREGFVFCYR